mmetsp:Transcript_20760/g.38789  ORF Transcript_20760/g.38789 Transcript_20760/m.38789 type:complete len:96 (-) Transcript_20760:34-321(-)
MSHTIAITGWMTPNTKASFVSTYTYSISSFKLYWSLSCVLSLSAPPKEVFLTIFNVTQRTEVTMYPFSFFSSYVLTEQVGLFWIARFHSQSSHLQ